MSRVIQSAALRSRSSRRSIPQSPKLHIAKLVTGLALGYRKGVKGGSWFARRHEDGTRYSFHPLGIADDSADADGLKILTFDEAQEAARAWYRTRAAEDAGTVVTGKYTVAKAMEDYLVERERVKRKSLYRTRCVVVAHILPTLGEFDLSKLTHGRVKTWRDALADAAPRNRTKKGKAQKYRTHDASDADAVRKRQATANRVLSILKAALNYAHEETKRVATKAAWEGVKPFKQVDVAKVRFMTKEEITALLAHCPVAFGTLVRGALLTGCRYSELAQMHVSAFDAWNQTIFIPVSKNGDSRHIELNAEGIAFFKRLTKNKDAKALMFERENGKQWKPSEQKPPMDAACAAAKVEQVTFHILRHTYASHLAMNLTPMRVIADQLGHRDTRITERHYAHLGRAFVRDTIRSKMPAFGIAS